MGRRRGWVVLQYKGVQALGWQC